ncbi:helix-turn-helix transcriptional regulator [Phenylobacterium sp.]|jgi:transcriptional regulator with XRE-family HTH domain|uniref:helix-turn-helix domain-containing protein n=1 Tax=Phenylobacterium sp. TaxID=1871053 RepID=UPI002E34A309|nr:helix-turn-helix transcriptional regulator [Phenylobacterium sp.]HEX2559221.1 helix-turn-helix transcriptional regulator [Phenylobacterium sp.]
MAAPPNDDAARRASLAKALKAIRRRRGLRAADAAEALGMPLRSYEHFEAGRGRLNLERVHLAADALDADPYAIMAALEIGSPEFAARCADNKLMTIYMMALQDFDDVAGDDIAQLDPRTLIAAFTRLFDQLAQEARARGQALEDWRSGRGGAGSGAADPT